MARVRGKDTRPELKVRRVLHSLGYRFRLHRKDLPGRPDIVLPRYRTAVFVHGCFWHRHEGCRRTTSPQTRTTFWQSKFNATVERDERQRADLQAAGWNVVVVWECETRDVQMLRERLQSELELR
jgi:DNA mismatch endonuclease, patch repair protein